MKKNNTKNIEGIEYILLDEDKFDNQGKIKEKMSSVKDQGHLLTIISQIKSLLSSIISK